MPGNLEPLEELAARGVVGFKAFMSASGIDDFERADDLTFYEGMQRPPSLDLPVAVHAESEAITAGLTQRARAAGRTEVRDYLASRPVVAELEAIARASPSPRRPAAPCTSSTSRPAAASRSWPRPARAAST